MLFTLHDEDSYGQGMLHALQNKNCMQNFIRETLREYSGNLVLFYRPWINCPEMYGMQYKEHTPFSTDQYNDIVSVGP